MTVAHRRAGKTVARINKLIRKAVECRKPNPRFGYLAPFFVQAKDIAWLYLLQYAEQLIQLGGKVNASELSVTLPHNGAVIRLYGAENADRMRGVYFDGIAIDEAQDIAPHVLTQIIMPALADRQGWLDVGGTPKGWSNLLGQLLKIAKQKSDEWFLQVLKGSETGILPDDELERLRALMPENEYEAEIECSFDAAITGAYYGKEFARADKEKRITVVQHDPSVPVHTAWDLGYSDDTAIWWYQVVGAEIHLIDFYAASGLDIKHYADQIALDSRRYRYGIHWLPHDAQAKTLASGGKSIEEQLRKYLGAGSVYIVPQLSVQDGIQATRAMLPHCWFDEKKCEAGIEALRQYQREWDDDKKAFREQPRHDWTSHPADAFRMLAVAWRAERIEVKKKPEDIARPLTLNERLARQDQRNTRRRRV